MAISEARMLDCANPACSASLNEALKSPSVAPVGHVVFVIMSCSPRFCPPGLNFFLLWLRSIASLRQTLQVFRYLAPVTGQLRVRWPWPDQLPGWPDELRFAAVASFVQAPYLPAS